jgi:transposase
VVIQLAVRSGCCLVVDRVCYRVGQEVWSHQHGPFPPPPNASTTSTTPTTYTTTTMSSYGSQISGNRSAGGELSLDQRNCIISKHKAGCTTKELAQEFMCSRRTIQRTIQQWETTSSNYSRPRSGHPPALTRREKRYAYHLARQKPKIQYRAMLQDLSLTRVSAHTLRSALQDYSLKKFRARRRPKINAATAAKRLQYAREGHNFNWQRTLVRFSDECSVRRGSGADTEWSFGYPDEKFDHNKVTEVETACGKQQIV